ncbi:Scytalone dehydratase arp1 [Lachnellula suecica]|uniref:Scytalone dehydratase arp1 n=1 Tax=Lachnellula suecica TaxID=602035 RepID=A0A8T9C9Z5_9HELO|nr:Scytalone dehydratase arp1 [Lachnellula suecica]
MSTISFEVEGKADIQKEYIELSALVFNWGDSYDAKDWDRLRTIIAPTLKVDYRLVMDERWYWPEFAAEAFVEMVSSPGFLGDPCIKTQHLLGATWWERVSDTEVIGHHQLRAAHLCYTAPDLKQESIRGHSHATNEHYYRKVNGVWKFAGLRPTVRWNEYDFDKIFKGIDFPEHEPEAPK